MSEQPTHTEKHTLPTLHYRDAKAAIVFCARVFGFSPASMTGAGGLIHRAELVWRGQRVAVITETTESTELTPPESAHAAALVVNNPAEIDDLYQRALAAGAPAALPPTTGGDGIRRTIITDPGGWQWSWESLANQPD